MKKEQLNDELTITGLIFLLGFLVFYLIIFSQKVERLSNENLEINKLAIELHESQKEYAEMLQSMNVYADKLEGELQDYKYLENLKKDLDRNPKR